MNLVDCLNVSIGHCLLVGKKQHTAAHSIITAQRHD